MIEKVALITGGATGIGRMTAHALSKQGIRSVITYRKSKLEAESLIRELKELYGLESLAVKADAGSQSDCVSVVSQALEEFGTIDIFIHNAGPYIHERKPMIEYSNSEWNELMTGNLNGFFYMAKEIIPIMRNNKWGRIVTLGFDRCESAPGWIYRSGFAAAKSGLTSLTKTLAMEEAGNGITVNMVSPGDIVEEWKEKWIADTLDVSEATVPVGRPGTGEDVARIITFLCDQRSDFITGAVIPVNGGKDVLGKINQ